MPENSPAKARALRIPMGSHTRDRLAKYRNLLTIVALLACVGWLLIGFRNPKTTANWYSPGPISQVHANLDCNSCHEDNAPVRERTFLADWKEVPRDVALWHRESDTKCQSCHPVADESTRPVKPLKEKSNAQIARTIPIAYHSNNQLVDSVASCAHCHAEHKGLENQLSRVSDANCIECHDNVEEVRGPKLPMIANHITRFDDDHPPFASLKTDPGMLKFNHDLHMTVGMLGSGVNEKMVRTIDSYPDHGGRLDGYASSDGKIELNCGFCHQPTDSVTDKQDSLVAISPSSSLPGRFMSMPTYDRDCQVCHSIDVMPHEDFDFERILRIEHGASPEKITESLQVYFSLEAIAPAKIQERISNEAIDMLKEIPTRLWNIENLEKKLNRDHNRPIQTAKVTIRTSCLKCHFESKLDTGSGIPDIQTIPIPEGSIRIPTVFETAWFETGRFDHSAHRDVDCAQCHEMNEGKNGLLRQEIKISLDKPMIKDHDSCVACHQSPDLVVAPSRPGPTNCIACHTYHNGGNRH